MASGFKIASAYVEVKADDDGLRAEVTRDVEAAGLGQNIKVGVKVDNDRGLTVFEGLLRKVKSSALDMVSSLGRGVVSIGAVGSTALTVAPAVASAVKWVVDLGGAAVQASPALLAIAAGGALVKLTMDQIGPAIVKQLSPISDGFKSAGTEASNLATKGVRPLAAEFTRLGMPIIASGMDKIAVATNGVVTKFLDWAKSTPGIQALRNVVDATGSAVQQLGPHVSGLLISFGNMIGRIAGVSLAAGANGLSGVLDKLTGWFDRVNAATVRNGLDGLIEKYHQVRDAISKTVDWVKQAIDFWTRYRTEIKFVQDALSILAIAFGGPVVAVVAAVGIIIRHWDDLKGAWKGTVDYFNNTPAGTKFMDSLRSASEALVPAVKKAWDDIKNAVGPPLEEIWDKIQNKVIPAIGGFISALAPLVAFLINVLGPVVASTFAAIEGVISAALDIITGIFQVATGILTGNWQMVWEGIKNIVSGVWGEIRSIVSGALNIVLSLFGTSLSQIQQTASNAWNNVKQTFQSAVDTAVSIVQGLVSRVQGAISWFGGLGGMFSGWWNSAVGAVTGAINSMIGVVSGIPGRITGALGNLGSLLYQAGVNVIQGLINGIRSMIGAVGSAISSVASTIRGALPFSPAKWGPLSGSGSPDIAGSIISQMIAQGMVSSVGTVAAATRQVAGAVFSNLPDIVKYGTVSQEVWNQLMAAGWTGRAGDGMEALYRPAAASGGGSSPVVYGSVSQSAWDQLKTAGWTGRAGDGMEALYAPSSGGGSGPVISGSVSDTVWQSLLAAGWKGDPNDHMEALYAPSALPNFMPSPTSSFSPNDFGSFDTGASSGAQQTTNNFNVTIDARSVAEMQSVTQFFHRVQQVARATTASAGRVA